MKMKRKRRGLREGGGEAGKAEEETEEEEVN